MFMCSLCHRFNRHKLHLITYGLVSLSLMVFGLVFSGFAIFQKESQIGKVWLAGPTTIVVGLVLCGKVMIDWGPAQLYSESSSECDEEQTMGTSDRYQVSVVIVVVVLHECYFWCNMSVISSAAALDT